ncbi:MDR/zinc-dependent alcohol dehydrogenase-like family protein [Flavisphingomonas formosensis]|uniref:hypothetical protein n=1 Tax=Flavisphingomonas formosensis TaxID=861534 RepID=UPI0012F93A79|nr:hypothetical protein [Sphingomonas formosensis]
MTENRRFILARRPVGMPKPTDFRIETGAVPFLEEGGLVMDQACDSRNPLMHRLKMGDSFQKVPVIGICS